MNYRERGGIQTFPVLPCLLVGVFLSVSFAVLWVSWVWLASVLCPQLCWNLACCPFLFCRPLFGGNFPDKFIFCVKSWFVAFFLRRARVGFLLNFRRISVSVSCVIHVLLSGMGFHLRLEVATCITFTLFDFHTCFFSCTIVAVTFGI